MRTLFVSPLPPSKCGIASYAEEHYLRLVSDGTEVKTASMLPDSKTDLHVNLRSLRSCLAFLLSVLRFRPRSVVVHYADVMFFPWRIPGRIRRKVLRVFQSLVLLTLAKTATNSSVIVHELPVDRELPRFNTWIRQLALGSFTEIAFHTRSMREEFHQRFPRISRARTSEIDHARFMQRRFHGTREEARAKLHLAADRLQFLCLGFFHQAKGFDEAITAFRNADIGSSAHLHVVGTPHGSTDAIVQHAALLAKLCEDTQGAFCHEVFVDDEGFDMWLAAADLLILPYRGVASSGVGARASLYGTRLLIRNLVNLTDQFPDAVTFEDEAALTLELQSLAAASPSHPMAGNPNC
ncbi:glycosyltransferase [Luteolibacter arcticus]|uniref:Glycosyltransferase n=1 Tax=Luteolibacter arcticus TaxID=1581411 RepID=A0ABT3GJ55_9BACT|nr:glycosyltransferase [Luteolibacter arcticus]MCW1923522.1 glycosyltransferase [Luteolibacter arcticus]